MKYQVGVKIFNSFEVEADSEEEAEIKVREMDLYDTFEHCDFNICYVDEVLPNIKGGHYATDGTFTPIDDESVNEVNG